MTDSGIIDQDIQGREGCRELLASRFVSHIESAELGCSTGSTDFLSGALTMVDMNVNHHHRGSGGGKGSGNGGSDPGPRARHKGRFLSKREHALDYQGAIRKSATV